MLHGGDSRQVVELVSEHAEKKFLRNLLTALQELDAGKRRAGKGQGKGGHSRQVCEVRHYNVKSVAAPEWCKVK